MVRTRAQRKRDKQNNTLLDEWDFRVLQRSADNDRFDRAVGQIVTKCAKSKQRLYCGAVNTQCTIAGELRINVKYVKRFMVPSANLLFAFVKKGGWSVGGIVLAQMYEKDGYTRFYVHLLCSSSRKGGALLKECERYARAKKADLMALRASNDGLVAYYRKRHGFRRVSNACTTASAREEKKRMRKLDSNTVLDGYWMSKCIQSN